MADEVAVFADTNLGTRIAFNALADITAGAIKRDIEKVHFACLPDKGVIQVNGIMVKRKSCFYYLPDSLPIKYAFPEARKSWFFHVEAQHRKFSCNPCLPHDKAILSRYKELRTCNSKDKAKCNSEEKRVEALQPREYLSEEPGTTNHVLKKHNVKGNPPENHMQNDASGVPERHSCKIGDQATVTTNKSQYLMPEGKVENRVELHANSMQNSLSKMSTQVISVTGIINKYFPGFNAIDNLCSSSNSDVTSRAVHCEIEVQSNTREHSCSKRSIHSLAQFTPKTPPHVLHSPLHVDSISKKSGSKSRRSKIGKHSVASQKSGSKHRRSKVGQRLLVASRSLGVSTTDHSPTLSFCRFRDKKLLENKPQINGSIFSLSDSDA